MEKKTEKLVISYYQKNGNPKPKNYYENNKERIPKGAQNRLEEEKHIKREYDKLDLWVFKESQQKLKKMEKTIVSQEKQCYNLCYCCCYCCCC